MKPPMVVIIGETASGKSELALQLAERYDGEIVCADSRTIYTGMDIGTAKPTAAERERVAHHMLDIVRPDEPFTAADFKLQAQAVISGIAARGRLPVMVGGTGLYVDAILYDYTFRAPPDPKLRAELRRLTIPELQDRLAARGIPLPGNASNPRHLIRAIESGGQPSGRSPLRDRTLLLGLALERGELRTRIESRVDRMIASGLEKEARRLADTYGFNIPPMQTIGYQEWQEYLAGRMYLEQVQQLIIKNTLAYAKRQRTWFRRNNSVHWLHNRGETESIDDMVTTLLNK